MVIGILIALQIDNWNNNNLELQKEQVVLKGLKLSFENNLKKIKITNTANKVAYDASLNLMEYINPEIVEHAVEAVDSLISLMINFATYDPSIGIIENIINSGELDLINNEKIKFLIGLVY